MDVGPKIKKQWLYSLRYMVWNSKRTIREKYLAIFPVSGWWKELKSENRQLSVAKYSLVVSIETPENNLAIYNEIQNLISIDNQITNLIQT